MRKYNPNIYKGIHTVKITLQQWEYKGHIVIKIRGNCKGRSVLDFDFGCEENFQNNNCQMKYHKKEDYFTCVLKNGSGNTLRCEGDAEEMNDMIVGVEIIDFCEE